MPIIVGTDGPYTSASKTPTFFPKFFKLNAKFKATVDFPTPPLQLDTAIIFLTFLRPNFLVLFSLESSGLFIFSSYLSCGAILMVILFIQGIYFNALFTIFFILIYSLCNFN